MALILLTLAWMWSTRARSQYETTIIERHRAGPGDKTGPIGRGPRRRRALQRQLLTLSRGQCCRHPPRPTPNPQSLHAGPSLGFQHSQRGPSRRAATPLAVRRYASRHHSISWMTWRRLHATSGRCSAPMVSLQGDAYWQLCVDLSSPRLGCTASCSDNYPRDTVFLAENPSQRRQSNPFQAYSSPDPNWVRDRLIEEIALLVEGDLRRLRVARRVGGTGHDRVLARLRVPRQLESRPRVLHLRFSHGRVPPSLPGIETPLHFPDRSGRRVGIAAKALEAGTQLCWPRQRQRALYHLGSDYSAQRFTFGRIVVTDEYIRCGVVASPEAFR